MLNSKLLFDYYAFVVSYWQKKFNASKYNIEVSFYQYAMTIAVSQQEKDDTELNRSLVDLEIEAQANYLYVCKQRRAGLVTDTDVETALINWREAKAGRRNAVPNTSLLISLLRDKAQSNFNLFDTMRRKIYDPDKPRITAADKQKQWDELSQVRKDEYNKLVEWMTITQGLRDSVNTFETQIQLFLETSEQSIDSIEDTQEAPVTYQDIINESMYTFDGSYSDAANHIAPTGQVTGQLQVILKVTNRIYWTGLAWLQMPDEIDQCANTSLLPAEAEIGTIFRIPPTTSASAEWSYHYKTAEGWIPMVRLWDIDGWGNRPAHGTMIGEYHILLERNVPTIWTGYEKIRIPHSVLYDDVYGMHMPPGFITTFTDLQSSHNELAEDYLGYKGDVEEALSNVAKDIGEMNGAFNDLRGSLEDMLSDGFITFIEASLLKTLLSSLLAESEDVMAESLALNIVAERASYHTAINNLIDAFSVWLDPINLSRDDLYWTEDILLSDTHLDENEYPIEVDPSVRTNIKSRMSQLESAKSVLIHAITAKRSEVSAQVAADEVSFDLSQFRQVYDGFVRGFTPEFELIYVSENELSLRPRYNDFDYLTINEQNIEASKRTSVFTFTPVLNWNRSERSLYYSMLQPSTEYWVYLANRSVGFNLNVYDFRGRLFCSSTEPSNNYLGTTGLGLNAILIGKAQTNTSGKFIHELDVSLISRQSDLKETFREFSDFDLVYNDQDTLALRRIYGTYGQIYVPESLYYIGENREVSTTSPRIIYDEDLGTISYDDSTIGTNTLYYVYIASNSDLYNFNDLNPATGLPWHPEDEGSTGIYDADKDFRLWMFLSTKEPEEGRLSESYYGYWARHVGQVRTDGTRKFIFSSSISAIRQATLRPEYLDGLAEIYVSVDSYTTLKVAKNKGTSGIFMVGGSAVQCYEEENPSCHYVIVTDTIYTYDEEDIDDPLKVGDQIQDFAGDDLNLYITNAISAWGTRTNKLIASTNSPVSGYLSGNFPGNAARWVARITISEQGLFGANTIKDSIFGENSFIDDSVVSSSTTWSSEVLSARFNQLLGMISAGSAYDAQTAEGLPLVLSYVDQTHIKLTPYPAGGAVTIYFPGDFKTRIIPVEGITLELSGNPGIRNYIYLSETDFYLSTTQPTGEYPSLETLGESLQVGDLVMTGSGSISAKENVCSSHHQPTETWASTISGSSSSLSLSNLVLSKRVSATLTRTGQSDGDCWYYNSVTGRGYGYQTFINAISGGGRVVVESSAYTLYVDTALGLQSLPTEGVNTINATYSDTLTLAAFPAYSWNFYHVMQYRFLSRSGNLVLTRTSL